MAIVNFVGFEAGDTSESSANANTSIQGTTKRTGDYALRLNLSAQTGYFGVRRFGSTNDSPAQADFNQTTLYFTFYMRVGTLPGSAQTVAQAGSGSSRLIDVQLDNAGALTLYNGSSSSSSAGTLTTGVWYRIDLKAVRNGTCELSINGGSAVTLTGANNAMVSFYCGNRLGSVTYDIYYDDIVVNSAAFPTDAPQVIRVDVDGNGTDTGYTGGTNAFDYLEVDDIPHDSDTTYTRAPGTTSVETYTLESSASAGVVDTIAAVKPRVIARTEGSTGFRVRVRSGSTTTDGTTGSSATTSYLEYARILETDPDTSAAWTLSGLNGLEVGPKSDGGVHAVRCTSVCAMVLSLIQSAPTITDVTPDTFANSDEVVIDGSTFGSTQGTGKVELGDDDDYGTATLEEQTVDAWADDEITITVVRGALDLGSLWMFVTNDDSETSEGFPVTLDVPSIVGTIDLELEISALVSARIAVIGTVDLEIEPGELPTPPALEFELTGTVDLEIEPEAIVRTFTAVTPGESTVDVYNPAGVYQGTLTPLRYRISRYSNQVGDWDCELPVDEEVDEDDLSLASKIEYGWKISITQENFSPDHGAGSGHLLYQGIVEDRSFPITQGGQTKLVLKGSFRTYAVVRRSVLHNLEYDGPLSTLTSTLVGSLLDPYGPVYDAAAINVHVKGTFNDLSRYAAWLRAAELGRRTVRETWDHDRPELVRYDGPPDSGITFRPANDSETGQTAATIAARYAHDSGATGVALIAGTPILRWDGANVINRIIPVGVDTVEDPEDPESTISDDLTLQWATLASPYAVKAGLNPDLTLYYYIEDEESIERFGLTEIKLVFSDVKNPNDLVGSRQAAANVLYMRAVNQLIKRRSPKIEVLLPPLANGANIWALPGDQALLTYQGVVETESGNATWVDIDERRFLITERHETSDPSGIRRVAYKLAAPEMEFPVPGLPGEITFPPESPGNDPSDPDAPGSESCCEDPNNGQEEGPEEEWEETFPEPEAQYVMVGMRVFTGVISSNAGVPWDHIITGNIALSGPPPETFGIAVPSLGDGTWTVTARVSYRVSGDGTFAVLIKTGSTVLSSFAQSPGAGNINFELDEDDIPIIPTSGFSFESGEVTSVHVSVTRVSGSGLVTALNPTDDSYLRLSFVPAP